MRNPLGRRLFNISQNALSYLVFAYYIREFSLGLLQRQGEAAFFLSGPSRGGRPKRLLIPTLPFVAQQRERKRYKKKDVGGTRMNLLIYCRNHLKSSKEDDYENLSSVKTRAPTVLYHGAPIAPIQRDLNPTMSAPAPPLARGYCGNLPRFAIRYVDAFAA